MHRPEHIIEIFLQPGEYYFGDKVTRIRTVLGSCVSMTFWHPSLLVGGMSHFMLPTREGAKKEEADVPLNGKYADEAMKLLLSEMKKVGGSHQDYQVKLFGGGNMFPETRKKPGHHVGLKNVDAAHMLLKRHGFTCQAQHLGGIGHRNVIFDIWSGHVWVKHKYVSWNK